MQPFGKSRTKQENLPNGTSERTLNKPLEEFYKDLPEQSQKELREEFCNKFPTALALQTELMKNSQEELSKGTPGAILAEMKIFERNCLSYPRRNS